MSWNYRVVRYIEPDGAFCYGIHEAYYHGTETKPHAITKDAVSVVGDDGNELQTTLEHMQAALLRPILDYETREEIGKRKAIFAAEATR